MQQLSPENDFLLCDLEKEVEAFVNHFTFTQAASVLWPDVLD